MKKLCVFWGAAFGGIVLYVLLILRQYLRWLMRPITPSGRKLTREFRVREAWQGGFTPNPLYTTEAVTKQRFAKIVLREEERQRPQEARN
jgi:hypothetical protein